MVQKSSTVAFNGRTFYNFTTITQHLRDVYSSCTMISCTENPSSSQRQHIHNAHAKWQLSHDHTNEHPTSTTPISLSPPPTTFLACLLRHDDIPQKKKVAGCCDRKEGESRVAISPPPPRFNTVWVLYCRSHPTAWVAI